MVVQVSISSTSLTILAYTVVLMWTKSYCTTRLTVYRIAGMFGGVNVWRIAEFKVIGEIKFGEWIDFGHKDTITS